MVESSDGDVLPQFLPALLAGAGLDEAHACGSGRGGGRHGRGGEDEGPGAVDQVIHQRARAADVAARRAQRLAQRAHLDLDAVAHAQFLGQAATVCAVKPGRVGLVHHQPGAVFLLQRHDLAQRRVIAVHRKHALRHHQHAPISTSAFGPSDFGLSPPPTSELLLQIAKVIVGEHAQGRAAQAGRIHDAGVDELVQ